MNSQKAGRLAALSLVAFALANTSWAGEPALPAGNPGMTLDLTRTAELQQVQGVWRYHDVNIIAEQFPAPGADGQPGTTLRPTYTLSPQAGGREFDDHDWEMLPAESLAQRRGAGRLSFNWYRLRLQIPATINGQSTAGSALVLQTSVDDYAEIWVNGELSRYVGQSGGSVVAGWNAVNRLLVSPRVQPGQQFVLAIFGANGPLSSPPSNYIWVREARLQFYRAGVAVPYAVTPQEVNLTVQRFDPELDQVVPRNPKLNKLAEGFTFTEGPVWVPDPEGGYLLFSDPNENRIYRYDDRSGLGVFRSASGYSGPDVARYRQPGSNGLALDPQGRLTLDQHGNRRVLRLENDGETVLADRYEGKPLNSPNDLVYRADGSLYFTDPPFGLPQVYDDPAKALPYSGIYRWSNGQLTLLNRELKGPNGLAFSPDERFLYVGDWDDHHKVVMRYPVLRDGALGSGEIFADLTPEPGEDAIDGIKVDRAGRVYVSGPGGLWIFAADGRRLGLLRFARHPHNLAWGDDGQTLYLTAQEGLYRIRLQARGTGGAFAVASSAL